MMGGERGEADERRAQRRYAARIKVKFRSVEELLSTYSGDVSHGGLYVASAAQLPEGSLVQLCLDLPDGGPPVRIAARVAYVVDAAYAAENGRDAGMGMQFLNSDVSSLAARIARLLNRSVEMDAPRLSRPAGKVLVVDDSSAMRASVVRVLSEGGYEVLEAEHGLEALGVALKELPSLILSDVNMPVMNGWQLLRLIRSKGATRLTPMIFLTSLDGEEDRLRGYEMGIDDYLAKPFDEAELLLRVRRATGRSEERVDADDEHAMAGDLRQVALPSLLSFFEAEQRTGELKLHGPLGEAEVLVREGKVEKASVFPGIPGEDAFDSLMRILTWVTGRFVFSGVSVPAGAGVSIQGALLEHARREDEARAASE